jgi:hypothetical protein
MNTWESWKMAPATPATENAAPRGTALLATLGLTPERVHFALTGKPMPERLKALAATQPAAPKFTRHNITAELRKRIKRMKRTGHTYAEIAKFTGLTPNWVSRILLEKV